jgi:quercetin dioxygenase-like cupin family protein
MKLAASLLLGALALAQSAAVIIPDLATARWTHDARDGSDSVFLRQDPKTGAMDLLVRYPAGHKLTHHWHSANERLILLEGRLTVKVGDGPETAISPGGLLFAPAKEVHGMTCTSETKCTFYIAWDGKLDNHRAR